MSQGDLRGQGVIFGPAKRFYDFSGRQRPLGPSRLLGQEGQKTAGALSVSQKHFRLEVASFRDTYRDHAVGEKYSLLTSVHLLHIRI